MLLGDSCKTEFFDAAHYDIRCEFIGSYQAIGDLVVVSGSGLVPTVMSGNELKTQEFSLSCIVTPSQDKLLQDLYAVTNHPGYIDVRFPVTVHWGYESQYSHSCYLKSYAGPSSIDFRSAQILGATLTLRPL